ncbi:MAG: VOC family protein, partial [Kiritimatiellia bacterium]|nr:VOC family protein [Kiritimatiellia bacterium]
NTMEINKELKEKLNLPAMSQICIAVRDLDRAVAYYESLGLGPFVKPEISYTDVFYHGRPVTSKWIMGFCSLGQIEMELSQPVSGPNIYQDFLETKGEGIHHLGFDVKDMDERLVRYEKMGVRVLQSGRTPSGGFAYLDTTEIGGAIFEIIQRKSRRV